MSDVVWSDPTAFQKKRLIILKLRMQQLTVNGRNSHARYRLSLVRMPTAYVYTVNCIRIRLVLREITMTCASRKRYILLHVSRLHYG